MGKKNHHMPLLDAVRSNRKVLFQLCFVFILCSLSFSCRLIPELTKTFKKVNNNEELKKTTQAASEGIAQGIVEKITSDSAQLKRLLKSILSEVSTEGAKMTTGIRDSLLSKKTKEWLNQTLSELTESETRALIAFVNDQHLKNGLRQMVAAIRDEMLGKATAKDIALLRDEVLGKRTRQLTDSLISAALRQIAKDTTVYFPILDGALKRVDKGGKDLADTISQTTAIISWAVGGIVFIIVAAILYVRARKNRQTIEAVAKAIDALPRERYDEVAPKIKESAVSLGVNTNLNRILDSTELKNRKLYKNPDGLLALSFLADKINNNEAWKRELENDSNIHDSLKSLIKNFNTSSK